MEYQEITQDTWRTYLHERGVQDEEINARGYRWVHSGKPKGQEFASYYGFSQKSGGLLIPLHSVHGELKYQLRVSTPAAFTDRKAGLGSS